MEIRVGPSQKEVVSPGVMPLTRDEVEVRKAKDGVSEEQVIAAVKDNNRDELVVRGDDGNTYVVSAAKLDVAWRFGFPVEGERLTAGDIEGSVAFADNETNVAHIIGRVSAGAMALSPAIGIAYGWGVITSAPSLIEIFIGLVTFGRNALIGTAVSGLAIGSVGVAAGVVDVIKDQKRADSLDELTETIGTGG